MMRSLFTAPLFFVIFTIILGAGVYFNSLSGSFTRSDDLLLSATPSVSNVSDICKVFTSSSAYKYPDRTLYLYRPVQTVSFAADRGIWGEYKAGPRVTNLLLHILAALALYWMLSLVCSGSTAPMAASLIFLVHPAYSHAVSSVSDRGEMISALFALAYFISYIKYSARPGRLLFLTTLSSFILSVLAFEAAVIIPALLIFYCYQFRKRMDLRLITPLIATAILFATLRATVFKGIFIDSNMAHGLKGYQGLAVFFDAVTAQIKVLISPGSLIARCANPPAGYLSHVVTSGIIATYVFIVVALTSRNSRPLTGLALIWFLSALFMALAELYPVSGAYSLAQWFYFPSIGIFMALASALDFRSPQRYDRYIKTAVLLITALLVSLLSCRTIRQNAYWREPVNQYKTKLKSAPDDIKANSDLALAYEKAGQYDEAIEAYNSMLKKNPGHPDIYVNLAAIQIIKRNPESAAALCLKAIELEPSNATAHNNLAVAYYMQDKYDLAIKEADMAVKYGYRVKQQLLDLLRPYREE